MTTAKIRTKRLLQHRAGRGRVPRTGAPAKAKRWRSALTVQVRELASTADSDASDGVQMTVRVGESALGAALLHAGFEALRRSAEAGARRPLGKARQAGGGAC